MQLRRAYAAAEGDLGTRRRQTGAGTPSPSNTNTAFRRNAAQFEELRGTMAAHTRRFAFLRTTATLLLTGVAAAAGLVIANASGILQQDPARGNYPAIERTLSAARSAARAIEDRTSLAAATALQRAIQYSRGNAKRSGTHPIPPEVKTDLQYYFSKSLLNRVEWTPVGPELDLASLVATWYRREGGAVTLQDVIVYSRPDMVQNRTLWAHELTHALQYEELGPRDFARVYLTNHQVLEQQARENAARIANEIRRNRQPPPEPARPRAEG